VSTQTVPAAGPIGEFTDTVATARPSDVPSWAAPWRRWARPAVLVGLVAAVTIAHLLTPVSKTVQHDVFVRLYYLPIVLGGVWYGLAGGIGTAGLICLVYLPHVLIVDHGLMTTGYLLEIPIFLAVGALTGLFVDRQAQYRRGLELQAETLERSHRELKDQTRLLLEKEVQLRRADRLSALGQLSAGLAHEIRNPLGAIKGAVEILADDYPAGHPKAEFYAILVKEVERLNEVLTNFLNFARPVTPRLAPVDIPIVLAQLEGLLSGQARSHQVEVFTSYHAGPSRVMADETLLKQAFLNIMLNAIEAMGGGGDLAISTRLPGARAGDRPDWIEVVFDDTGPGIAEGDLGRVFDPFFTTKKDGTGLGLAITHRIIENHHGTIRVASQRGKGTTFVVSLPLEGARLA
jgi:two-component system, NtrC family, sensor histidine kinase HydH